MELPLHQVDAFTNRVFGGNPAAVIQLESWLEDSLLLSIAQENNLSETAFLVKESTGYRIRWFTPAFEVDLCGHATLASAHVLFETGQIDGPELRLQSRSGELIVRRDDDRLVLDFPADPPEPIEYDDALAAALGRDPVAFFTGRYHLAVFETASAVAALKPDMSKLSQHPALAVVATAPGEDCDFVSRFFGPRVGVPEDPVTGSAHCLLVPYWKHQLGRSELHARQISARGGELHCEDRGERVLIAGQAVSYLVGRITVPDPA